MDVAIASAIIGAIATLLAAILGAWLAKKLQGKRSRKGSQSGIVIETFTINSKKCNYKEYSYDPKKTFWPPEDKGAVVWQNGKLVERFGKPFRSWKQSEAYRKALRKSHNHRSFSNISIHKKYFERLNGQERSPNYPNFYFTISNNTEQYILMRVIEAVVLSTSPLMSSGASHALTPLATYSMRIAPRPGNTRASMVPNLKVEAGDSVAFDVFLIPETSRVGGHWWLMKLKVYYSEQDFVETDYFEVVM